MHRERERERERERDIDIDIDMFSGLYSLQIIYIIKTLHYGQAQEAETLGGPEKK